MKSIRKIAAVLSSTALLAGAAFPNHPLSVSAVTVSAAANDAAGWFESAYLTWTPVSGASGYNVYADGKQIDSMLIRQYAGYFRADALGLKAGSHTLKAVPVISGREDSSKAIEKTVSVQAFDRSGFAWVNGTASGAYNEDGTLKDNAVVLYVTEQTKDSVTADIITSSKGTATKTTGIQEILNAIKKGYDTRPFCIRVIGTVTDPNGIGSVGGDLTIDGGGKYKAGMTLEGVGTDAVLYGFGVKAKNMSNLEIRNLAAMLCDSDEGDNFSLQQDNDHVWVHNCDSFYGMAGGDADQAKGDGALDCKKSTYITFSYNHFYDNGKCNLLGLKENTTSDLYITYHHNWYDHSDSRHPRVRFYTAHVYNNYYDGNAKYGIGSTQSSSIFAESNYYRNCKYPMLISMQGSDVLTGGTFSSEDGGIIKAYGNFMTGQASFVPYSENNTDFDAYVVANKSDKVPGNVIAKQTSKLGAGYSHTYNNFDTSANMYQYQAQDAKDVPAVVTAGAGRMDGGDFKWAFTDADDEDYKVNTALMNALKAYKSGIVSIGSGSYIDVPVPETTAPAQTATTTQTTATSAPTSGSDSEESTTSTMLTNPNPASSYVHNFTENGLNSTFFTISGNLSTSKGTVEYNGLTLTQCLKMESATSISFSGAGTLSLVFGEPAANVKIDGNKISADNGVVKVPVASGAHTITKADTCNLFYMVLETAGETISTTAPAVTTESTTTATTTTPAETTTAETTTTSAKTQPAGVPGDLTGDGEITVSDAVLLARLAGGDATLELSADAKALADIDGDGLFGTNDLATLLRWIVGIRE